MDLAANIVIYKEFTTKLNQLFWRQKKHLQ